MKPGRRSYPDSSAALLAKSVPSTVAVVPPQEKVGFWLQGFGRCGACLQQQVLNELELPKLTDTEKEKYKSFWGRFKSNEL